MPHDRKVQSGVPSYPIVSAVLVVELSERPYPSEKIRIADTEMQDIPSFRRTKPWMDCRGTELGNQCLDF
jgi:hypothetical protein